MDWRHQHICKQNHICYSRGNKKCNIQIASIICELSAMGNPAQLLKRANRTHSLPMVKLRLCRNPRLDPTPHDPAQISSHILHCGPVLRTARAQGTCAAALHSAREPLPPSCPVPGSLRQSPIPRHLHPATSRAALPRPALPCSEDPEKEQPSRSARRLVALSLWRNMQHLGLGFEPLGPSQLDPYHPSVAGKLHLTMKQWVKPEWRQGSRRPVQESLSSGHIARAASMSTRRYKITVLLWTKGARVVGAD